MNEIANSLKTLTEIAGTPGQEDAVRYYIADIIRPSCKELREDSIGNLIAEVHPGRDYSIGILAHMDEVGFIVSKITEKGLICFELMGNIDPGVLVGTEVDIIAQDGKSIRGVIGNQSRHLQISKGEKHRGRNQQLYIDIGAETDNKVLGHGVAIGSGVVFATKFQRYTNGTITGKALDNRIGCAVLMSALRTLKDTIKNINVLGMFTCQEEIGAKGARVVAYNSQPCMTITLDTVPVKNPDACDNRDINLNRGPVIRVFDRYPQLEYGMYTHPAIRKSLLRVAEAKKIKHQIDVMASTYLDSSQVHLSRGGIPGGSICFPRRYAHSQVEMCHLNDIKDSFNLLIEFIAELDRDPISFGRRY